MSLKTLVQSKKSSILQRVMKGLPTGAPVNFFVVAASPLFESIKKNDGLTDFCEQLAPKITGFQRAMKEHYDERAAQISSYALCFALDALIHENSLQANPQSLVSNVFHFNQKQAQERFWAVTEQLCASKEPNAALLEFLYFCLKIAQQSSDTNAKETQNIMTRVFDTLYPDAQALALPLSSAPANKPKKPTNPSRPLPLWLIGLLGFVGLLTVFSVVTFLVSFTNQETFTKLTSTTPTVQIHETIPQRTQST